MTILSMMILLVAMFSQNTLDFSAFPTVLLFSTLLRLALNVASTRVILMNGHTGEGMPGKQMAIDADLNAGLMIIAINIIGGLIIGVMQHDMSVGMAVLSGQEISTLRNVRMTWVIGGK